MDEYIINESIYGRSEGLRAVACTGAIIKLFLSRNETNLLRITRSKVLETV